MTDYVPSFVNGTELEASDLNTMRSNRTGNIKPIDNTTSNYSDNADDLGASTNVYANAFVGNIKVTANTISSTDTNGDLNLTPNGTGYISTSESINHNSVVYKFSRPVTAIAETVTRTWVFALGDADTCFLAEAVYNSYQVGSGASRMTKYAVSGQLVANSFAFAPGESNVYFLGASITFTTAAVGSNNQISIAITGGTNGWAAGCIEFKFYTAGETVKFVSET